MFVLLLREQTARFFKSFANVGVVFVGVAQWFFARFGDQWSAGHSEHRCHMAS